MPVSLRKCTTWFGSPIPFLYPKRIKIGGCMFIILIFIRHAKKILVGFLGSIRLWTPQPVAAF
jgi:hypothetical protein